MFAFNMEAAAYFNFYAERKGLTLSLTDTYCLKDGIANKSLG